MRKRSAPTIWPPVISAQAALPGEAELAPVEPFPKPEGWRYHDLEVDRVASRRLAIRLTEGACGAVGWKSYAADYLDRLVPIARRLEQLGRRLLDVTQGFGVVVLDNTPEPHLLLQCVGQSGLELMFPGWAEKLQEPDEDGDVGPPVASTSSVLVPQGVRDRWRRLRRAGSAERTAGDELVEELMRLGGLEAMDRRAFEGALVALLTEPSAADRPLESTIDDLLTAFDRGFTDLLGRFLGHPMLQSLESTWRATAYLVDRVANTDATCVELTLLQASHDDLWREMARVDTESAALPPGLRKHWIDEPHARAEPLSLLVDLGFFDSAPSDIDLLSSLASVAARAMAPLLSNASNTMFGDGELAKLKDLETLFEEQRYARWSSFRDSPQSLYAALVVNRFRTRLPHEVPFSDTGYVFREVTTRGAGGPPWGPPVVLLVGCIVRAFAQTGMPFHFIGGQTGVPGGGIVRGMPARPFHDEQEARQTAWEEHLITSRRWSELTELGFAVWSEKYLPTFYDTYTCHRPWSRVEDTPETKQAEVDSRVGSHLPHHLYLLRFAHYLRVIAKQSDPGEVEPDALQATLQAWLDSIVFEGDEPSHDLVLRAAAVVVRRGARGALRFELCIRPFRTWMAGPYSQLVEGRLYP